MANIIEELKRRNVFRVAAAYAVVSWVLVQVVTAIEEPLGLPQWFDTAVIVLLLIGFPISVLLAWAFELTPGGLKRAEDVDNTVEAASFTGRKIDFVIIGALILAVGFLLYDRSGQMTPGTGGEPPAISETGPRTIAVLPFINLSSDKEQEYFSDGMTEEILNALAKVKGLKVTARTSVFAYKGQNLDLREVGRQLGVATILEGSVRKAGDQVRVTAQLIETDTAFHLWSETYDRKLENIFAIQEDISVAIAEALSLTLNLEQTPVVPSRTENLDAYDKYLKALALHRGRTNVAEGVRLLREVVKEDPDFAPAWAALAKSLSVLPIYMSREDRTPAFFTALGEERESAARRALELAPNSAAALHAMGSVVPDFRQAREYFQRALQVDPSSTEVMEDLVGTMFSGGHSVAAVKVGEEMAALDPIPVNLLALAMAYAGAARYDEAIATYRRVIALDPSLGPALWFGTGPYYLKGDFEGLKQHIRSMAPFFPEVATSSEDSRLVAMQVLATDGREPSDWPQKLARRTKVIIAVQIGDLETALGDLNINREGGAFDYPWIFGDQRFADLRKSSGFKEIIESAGFPEYWREFGWPEVCQPVGDDDFECQ